ncbi:HD-GYP domain-containing protein [Deinococcus frigens]|uniref:HD-GYP domain-containing protein n=1 Tax=Deinococcus frigens TaxID=249403 RepID=UPI00068D0596|nr:HD-GYP domain-containing protein [Deinococcus frigens]
MSSNWASWNNPGNGVWKADSSTLDLTVEANFQEASAWVTAVVGRPCEGHERRVAELTLKLAIAADLIHNERDVRQIVWAGLLHDIGKAAIDPRILNKPAALTPAEFDVIQQHPGLGYRLARTAPQIDDETLDGILYHHERWDGEGYPMGLIGESIPLLARLLKVTDVYDALVSDRPYRAAWTADEAATYLLQHSGMAFDPRLIQIFAYRVLPFHQQQGFPLD